MEWEGIACGGREEGELRTHAGPVNKRTAETPGLAGRLEERVGSGVLQVPDSVLAQPGCTDGFDVVAKPVGGGGKDLDKCAVEATFGAAQASSTSTPPQGPHSNPSSSFQPLMQGTDASESSGCSQTTGIHHVTNRTNVGVCVSVIFRDVFGGMST